MMPEWTPIRGARGWLAAACVAWASWSCATSVLAQVQGTPAAQPTGEIEVSLDSFGVGATARVGEYVGLRIAVTDGADRPREVLVSVSVKDGDGDTPIYQDTVTTNPGLRQPVWLYPRLPFWFNSSSVLVVNVHAAQEIDPPPRDPSLAHHAPGRLLGQARIPAPQRLLGSQIGMFGVIGRRVMGLGPYEGDPNRDSHITGHERTEIVPIDLAAMPDRWLGLAQFDVIAWGEGDPGRLPPDAAHAIREWVRNRGGHLIVVVPRVGQAWSEETTNPIHDLIPDVKIERRDNVNLGSLEPIIRLVRTDSRGEPVSARPLPDNETLHVFAPLTDGSFGENVYPILNTRDGECLVVRRLEGAGAVTLVGLDLSARFFADNTLPRPELFWHRLLGRRGVLLDDADFSRGPETPFRRLALPMRENYTLDRDFGGHIDKKEQAAAGVLIGFVVFVAYWLVAGPIGFFVLKRFGYGHHAWVAFLGAAVLFTGIAWGGATAIRPSRVSGFHLTFLDHVYGQGWQRARSWVNVLVPAYGEAGISVGDPAQRVDALPAGPSERVHNAIVPWEPPGSGAGGGFPDARAYAIESKSPEAMRFPARSTVKQFEVEWSGGPRWGMPTPEPDASGERRLELLPAASGQPAVRGVLKHNLPGPLKDVVLIVVRGQKTLSPSAMNANNQRITLLAHLVIRSRSGPWLPGEAWDLSTVRQAAGDEAENQRYFADELLDNGFTADDTAGVSSSNIGNLSRRLTAISLFTQLAPPDINQDAAQKPSQPLALRRLTHGLDLGRWFTQPCVIVIGHLGDDPSPIPLFVDAGGGPRAAPTSGRTVVRWVYPLPASPPTYPPEPRDTEGGGEGNAG